MLLEKRFNFHMALGVWWRIRAGVPWAPPLQLLGWSEDIQEVGLAGGQLGVRGALGALFESVLAGPLSEPIPDGL